MRYRDRGNFSRCAGLEERSWSYYVISGGHSEVFLFGNSNPVPTLLVSHHSLPLRDHNSAKLTFFQTLSPLSSPLYHKKPVQWLIRGALDYPRLSVLLPKTQMHVFKTLQYRPWRGCSVIQKKREFKFLVLHLRDFFASKPYS